VKTREYIKARIFLASLLTLLLCFSNLAYGADSDKIEKRKLGRTDWIEAGGTFRTEIRDTESISRAETGKDYISHHVSFGGPGFEKVGEYDRVTLAGCDVFYGPTGTPVLPAKTLRLLIPDGSIATAVSVIPSNLQEIEGEELVIEPAGERVPLSKITGPKPTVPDFEIYNSNEAYPVAPCGDAFRQTKGIRGGKRFNLLVVNIHPVVYYAKDGKIAIYKNFEIRITITQQAAAQARARTSTIMEEKDLDEIYSLVDNPELVETYRKSPATKGGAATLGAAPLTDYEYVVITTNHFRDATGDNTFETLCQSKRNKGITATIVTLEDDIYPNYTGVDNQEKIRNFIIDYYENHGTHYILLGGGAVEVPPRSLWVEAWPGSSYKDHIPSDSYYGCLDGNYNSDGDAKWGEPTDGPGGGEVDLYAEVFVGRAPVEVLTDMRNLVRKTLAYENSSDAYLAVPYSVGEFLGFGGPSQYAKQSMEEIRLGSSMHGYTTMGFEDSPYADFYDTQVLYDADGTWPKSELIGIINADTHMLNHLGHANYSYCMKLYTSDLSSLTNDKYFFAYSQGCMPGGFDRNECFAEVVTTMDEGAFAVIMNARYGWGTRNSTDGPSQNFHRELWDAIFAEDMFNLGRMNQDSKEDNIGKINNSCIRWCMYELNLFGDPEIQIQTGQAPGDYRLTVEIDPIGSGSVTLDPLGPWYDEGTIVTLDPEASGGNSFASWSGDLSGSNDPETITMDSDKSVTAHFTEITYNLTVSSGTGSGTYPEGTVVDIGADPPPAGYRFIFWSGDTENITDVDEPYTTITMLDNADITATYIIGKYNLSANCINGTLTIEPYKPDGYDYGDSVELTVHPSANHTFTDWTGDVPEGSETDNPLTIFIDDDKSLTAHCEQIDPPDIYIQAFKLRDDWSGESRRVNGDKFFNPGERIILKIALENTGASDATNVRATLSSSDSNVTIPQEFDTADFPDIPVGQSMVNITDYVIEASDSVTPPHEVNFHLQITADQGCQCDRQFGITIQEPASGGGGSIPDGKRVDLGDPAGANDSFRSRIASDDQGNVYVVYTDGRHGQYDVYFNHSNDFGKTWFIPDIRLNTNSAGSSLSYNAEITCDENGNVYVVWTDERSIEKDIYFNYSDDYGRPGSWLASDIRIDRGNGWSTGPIISCDENGNVYVVWYDYRNGNWDVYINRSRNKGAPGTWLTNDIRLNTNSAGSSNSAGGNVVCDNSGGVYVTWRDTRKDEGDIYFNYSHSYGGPGTWQVNDILINKSNTVNGWSWYNVMACDDSGYIYVAWGNAPDMSGDFGMYFNYSANRGVTWQSQDIKIASPGADVITSFGYDIDCDENGNVYLVWIDWRGPKYDVYFDSSKNHGATWRSSDIRLDVGDIIDDGSRQPSINCSEDGKVYVAWGEGAETVYLNYSENRGDSWNGAVRLEAEGGSELWYAYPSLDADSIGSAYIAWQDRCNGNLDIYFVPVTEGGSYPTVDPILDKSVNEGQTLAFAVTGKDNYELELFFNNRALSDEKQENMSNAYMTDEVYNPGTGETISDFMWVPPVGLPGVYDPIYFVARAPSGRCGYQDMSITVTGTNLYTLTVVNGTGDGDYAQGDTVGIQADAPSPGTYFKEWTGAIQHIANIYLPNTTITMPAQNITVTATYENVYRLTVVNGTGDGNYPQGEVANISADAPRPGTRFKQWTGATQHIADVNSPSTTVTMPSLDITVTATYERIHTLTVIDGDGDGIYTEGTEVTITADTPPAGKRFREWAGDVSYVEDIYAEETIVTMPNSNVVVVATYEDVYTLTVVSGSGDGSYAQGERINITADSAGPGTRFKEWTGDAQHLDDPGQANTTVTMPAQNITVTATYENIYNLTVISGSGDGVYAEGTEVTIEADPAPAGKRFREWAGDTAYADSIYDEQTIVTMPNDDVVLVATYEDVYTLTVVTGSGSGEYAPGERIYITAVDPAPGTRFKEWTGDTQFLDDSSLISTTVTMPRVNVTVAATYENLYTLNVVNGEGDGIFVEGIVCPIVADDPIGYIFKNWTGDIGTVEDANAVSTTITMLDNYTIIGNTVKLGDVDGDAQHRVTMTDAIQASEYSIGLREFTDDQILAANVDGINNGRNGVSMTDAIIISEYALGLRSSWPVEE